MNFYIYFFSFNVVPVIRPDIWQVKSVIGPDTGYIKRAGLSGRPDIRCIPI
jgi:hypothetical protein